MRVRTLVLSSAIALGFAGLLSTAGTAADLPAAPGARIESSFRLFDEVRVGVYAHNPSLDEKETVDVSGQILSSPINAFRTGKAWADALLNPRLHVGGMLNTEGLTSYAYAGFTWRAYVFDKLFVEGELGGAWNNSPDKVHHNRITIGCPVTFRESAGVGYQFTNNISLLANVEHISHANLCGDGNPGLTDFGVKLGYKF